MAGRWRQLATVALGCILAVTSLFVVGASARHQAQPAATPSTPATSSVPTTWVSPTPVSTAPAPPQRVYQQQDHPLHDVDAGLADTACPLPQLSRDTEGQRRYYLAAIECLDALWNPVLASLNLPVEPVELELHSHGDTACGVTVDAGLYCDSSYTIHISTDVASAWFGDRATGYLDLIGHEYAHHVQNVVGLAGSRNLTRDGTGPLPARGRNFDRRYELQAMCFSGLFLAAAVRGGVLAAWHIDQARSVYAETLASDIHGTAANQAAWFERGVNDGTISDCNTWVAEDETVS